MTKSIDDIYDLVIEFKVDVIKEFGKLDCASNIQKIKNIEKRIASIWSCFWFLVTIVLIRYFFM